MNILPVIAILGRPNVGKSTLFNVLCQSHAIVADTPGVTCDRHYGRMQRDDQEAIIIDTAGITSEDDHPLQHQLTAQATKAMEEADHIFWMVDGQTGLTTDDHHLATHLRKQATSFTVLVNKTEKETDTDALDELVAHGFHNTLCISAKHRKHLHALYAIIASVKPDNTLEATNLPSKDAIHLAVVGRPNVGKSTLINAWLNEERMIVADHAGTTKDSIATPFTTKKNHFVLIDTAGLRKKTKVTQASVEYLSIGRTLQAIHQAHVAILVLSANQTIAEQDLKIMRFIEEAGRGLVIAINQWDCLTPSQKRDFLKHLDFKLHYLKHVKILPISARTKQGIYDVLGEAKQAYQSGQLTLSARELTDLIHDAQTCHQPPLVSGRRIKLRYAHMVGNQPMHIMIHGKQCDALPVHYKRFLLNYIRKKTGVTGTPIRLSFKTDDNPFNPSSP